MIHLLFTMYTILQGFILNSLLALRERLHIWHHFMIVWLFSLSPVDFFYRKFQKVLLAALAMGPVPRHVSFIMDGNRRYAKSLNMKLKDGHEAGGNTLLKMVGICKQLGVSCVSAYAFSIENFNRPKEEVETLMQLLEVKLDEFCKRATDYQDTLFGSKLKVVGKLSLLNERLTSKIAEVERLTERSQEDEQFILYICLPYTSRDDIAQAIFRTALTRDDDETNIDIRSLNQNMYLGDYSNKCDLLVRTSGHRRLSDYMLWQVHENGTIEFCKTLWPDFRFLQMFVILLRWSFFKTLQDFEKQKPSLRDVMRRDIPIFDSLLSKKSCLEDLPEPPVAVSITGTK